MPKSNQHMNVEGDPRKLLFAAMLAAIVISCGHPSGAPERRPRPEALFESAPRSRSADDAGRFLAGMLGKQGTPFRELEESEVWKEYRRGLDRDWSRIETQWYPGMGKFQKTELARESVGQSLVFYPFSGPDTLMLSIFFPESPAYVMVGLEPAGTLPTAGQIAGKDLKTYLTEIRQTVDSELHRSFFITREMDRQLRGQVADGLFSPILQLLVRTGHTILGHRYVRLDDSGKLVNRPANYVAPGAIGNKGILIDFRTDRDRSVHTLVYLSVNLSDDRLRKNRPFLKFADGLGRVTTFLKATSYMPHHPGFSTIRNIVLDRSAAVLQDDSGLPYHLYDGARWRVQLYGDYDRPYGSFSWIEQPDLRKAYETTKPKPLGFRIGYGFSRIPSNLLLARRRR